MAEAARRLAGEELELHPRAARLMHDAVDVRLLSGRGAARVLAVARTIAALAGAGKVEGDHVAEALSYREPV